uniref:Disks large homolog 2 n=1 Tax=Schistocephalus solidus TaxID=70667 RepID=A0A0X3NMG3_SCHSO
MAFPIPAKRANETRTTSNVEAELDGEVARASEPYWYEVNNMDLGTATHEEAVRMLRNAGTRVHLVLCRPPPPSDHDGSSIDKLARKNRGFLSPSSTLSSAGPPSPTEVPRQPTARYRKR